GISRQVDGQWLPPFPTPFSRLVRDGKDQLRGQARWQQGFPPSSRGIRSKRRTGALCLLEGSGGSRVMGQIQRYRFFLDGVWGGRIPIWYGRDGAGGVLELYECPYQAAVSRRIFAGRNI